jgi:hypothetical protein
MTAGKKFIEWLWPNERRQGQRHSELPLVAYYWDGGNPEPRQVRDISPEGMYVLTERRWYSNTILQMSLTRTDRAEGEQHRSLRVSARVVRSGIDGVGFAFLIARDKRASHERLFSDDADRRSLAAFLESLSDGMKRMRRRSRKGWFAGRRSAADRRAGLAK